LLRCVFEAVPEKMDYTCLHDCLVPDGVHRVRQALQPVAHHHQHIGRTAVLDFRADPHPVLRPLPVAVLPGPQAQYVPLAVGGHAQGEVDGPVRYLPVADLDVDRIDEKDRVNRIQRPALPFCYLLDDPVGHVADHLLRHLGAVHLGQVRGNLPVGQALRGKGNHHVIDPGQMALPLTDDLRLETGVPVPRHRDSHRPAIREHRLLPAAVTGIPAITAFRVMPGVTGPSKLTGKLSPFDYFRWYQGVAERARAWRPSALFLVTWRVCGASP